MPNRVSAVFSTLACCVVMPNCEAILPAVMFQSLASVMNFFSAPPPASTAVKPRIMLLTRLTASPTFLNCASICALLVVADATAR